MCPNVTFEDDEFKEDNKALNDQGEGKRELILFVFLKLFMFTVSKRIRLHPLKKSDTTPTPPPRLVEKNMKKYEKNEKWGGDLCLEEEEKM